MENLYILNLRFLLYNGAIISYCQLETHTLKTHDIVCSSFTCQLSNTRNEDAFASGAE